MRELRYPNNLTAVLAFLITAFAMPPSASANVTIGFDGLSPPTEFTGPYTEDGFVLSAIGNPLYTGSAASGNPPPELESIAVLGDGVLRVVSEMAGQTFNFVGVDIAHYDSDLDPHQVIVEGFLDSVLVGNETFTTATWEGSFGPYSTVVPTGLLLDAVIDELRITLTGSGPSDFWYTRVDNVELSPIPEPATLALFGVGLAGIPFVRRRRTPA